VDVKALWA